MGWGYNRQAQAVGSFTDDTFVKAGKVQRAGRRWFTFPTLFCYFFVLTVLNVCCTEIFENYFSFLSILVECARGKKMC